MLNTKNILIVDDNVKNIQLAANVLKELAIYGIFFATSGEAAIKHLELREHSLILLDINMPGLDGYETAQIIKKDPLHKKIPIIFLSANANKESIRKGFENGGSDYITKPFDESELIHRVKTHVELYEAREKLKHERDDANIILEQYKQAVDENLLVSKTDLKGNITYVNDKFCQVSQYTKDELIGQPHNIVRSPDVDKETFKKLWKIIQNKQSWNGIVKNISKDGTAYYVDSNIIPILDRDDEIVEYISLRTNITKEILLREEIISSQKEILHTLGELGEWRSKETGEHVNRVALFSELIATKYGCSKEEVQLLKLASPMHDIGKVVISDQILLKPGKLTSDEFDTMKNHTLFGWEIFKKSKHKLLQTAALVSYEHHEKWNGTGYPRQLKGEEIHIFGRITSIADVFDALSHDRIYKKAWSIEETIEFIKSESGISFDPKLVDIFVENIEEIIKIKMAHQN